MYIDGVYRRESSGTESVILKVYRVMSATYSDNPVDPFPILTTDDTIVDIFNIKAGK